MKLPALKTVVAAYGGALEHTREFILVGVPALCLMLALQSALILDSQVVVVFPETMRDRIYRFWWIARVSPIVLFQLAWLYLYLPKTSKGPSLRAFFRPSNLAYLAKGALLLLLLWPPFIYLLPLQLIGFLDSLRSGHFGTVYVIGVAGILMWTYAMSRISLVIAATSRGNSLVLRNAWRTTTGNGLRLMSVLLMSGLPLYILAVVVWIELIPDGTFHHSFANLFAAEIIAGILLLAAAAVFMVAIAEAYDRLTGGPPSHDQILMRFE